MEFTTVWNKYFETLVGGVSRNVSTVFKKSKDIRQNNRCPDRKSSQNPIAKESKPLCLARYQVHLNRRDSLSKGVH